MVHWIEYLLEAKGKLQRLFGIAQYERCSTRNGMDMDMYIDIGTRCVRTLLSFVFISLLRITCRTEVSASCGGSYSICSHFLHVRFPSHSLPTRYCSITHRSYMTEYITGVFSNGKL